MATLTTNRTHHSPPGFDLFAPLRYWINAFVVTNEAIAHWICRLIPCCCPFERNISFLGKTYHIPPLCKINPVYNELVALRFRALTYLADVCHEDVTRYIC